MKFFLTGYARILIVPINLLVAALCVAAIATAIAIPVIVDIVQKVANARKCAQIIKAGRAITWDKAIERLQAGDGLIVEVRSCDYPGVAWWLPNKYGGPDYSFDSKAVLASQSEIEEARILSEIEETLPYQPRTLLTSQLEVDEALLVVNIPRRPVAALVAEYGIGARWLQTESPSDLS